MMIRSNKKSSAQERTIKDAKQADFNNNNKKVKILYSTSMAYYACMLYIISIMILYINK